MAYKEYVVQQGDCISSIAHLHGMFPDTLWNDPKNGELKRKREDPNILLPGDIVYVRDKEERVELCAVGKLHQFRRKGVPEKLVIVFKRNGEPRANESFILNIDGVNSEGKTDNNGKADLFISPAARKGTIKFSDEGDEFELDLGHLDPVTEITGIQARLRNLGLYDGDVDGELTEELKKAIRIFQERNSLSVTGKPDDRLKKCLQDIHGC